MIEGSRRVAVKATTISYDTVQRRGNMVLLPVARQCWACWTD